MILTLQGDAASIAPSGAITVQDHITAGQTSAIVVLESTFRSAMICVKL